MPSLLDPSIEDATLPTSASDYFWLSQGTGLDRDKRVTLLNAMSGPLGAAINAQSTDTTPAVGDFVAAKNGTTGKKIPVEAFEFQRKRQSVYRTGANSFRWRGADGVAGSTLNSYDAGFPGPIISGVMLDTEAIPGGVGIYLPREFSLSFQALIRRSDITGSGEQVALRMSTVPTGGILEQFAVYLGIAGLNPRFPCVLRNSLLSGSANLLVIGELSAGGGQMDLTIWENGGNGLTYTELLAGLSAGADIFLDVNYRTMMPSNM